MATFTETTVDGATLSQLVVVVQARQHVAGQPEYVEFLERVAYELVPDRTRSKVAHAIAVGADVEGNPARLAASLPVVSQTIVANVQASRSLVQTLAATDAAVAYIGSAHWVPPHVVVPSKSATITLDGGANGGEITLRAPDFGDASTWEPYRVSRQSRGGDLQIFQDPMWPKTEVLSLKFSYLDPEDREDLVDFLKASAGAEITLTDHYGREWSGFIITPAGEVVQDKRTTSQAAFKFQVSPS